MKPDIIFAAEENLQACVAANRTVFQSSQLKVDNKSLPPMWLKSRSASFSLGAARSKPYALFHYSDQASCIVTTTNFLALYKAVNQNHTEQGVEEEEGGVVCVCVGEGWGCRSGLQASRPDVMKEGGRRNGRGGGEDLINGCAKRYYINVFFFFQLKTALIAGRAAQLAFRTGSCFTVQVLRVAFCQEVTQTKSKLQHFPFIKVMNKKTNKL